MAVAFAKIESLLSRAVRSKFNDRNSVKVGVDSPTIILKGFGYLPNFGAVFRIHGRSFREPDIGNP